MNQGLFESLSGRFIDGTPLESVDASSARMRSIMDHLGRMFDTREGTIPHLEGYGLPDITEIYRKMPGGLQELQQAIRRCVELYEPRLINVRVKFDAEHSSSFVVMFVLSGDIRGGGTVRFTTTFTGAGTMSIAPFRRQG